MKRAHLFRRDRTVMPVNENKFPGPSDDDKGLCKTFLDLVHPPFQLVFIYTRLRGKKIINRNDLSLQLWRDPVECFERGHEIEDLLR